MRIIGGKFKGRILKPGMKGWPTRPTTDLAKEALFNILQNRMDFEAVSMLDLFGGAGNHSIEFLSRGCTDVTYVDKHYGCISYMKAITTELDVSDFITIVKTDVRSYLKKLDRRFDYVFAGPPYPLPWLSEIPQLICSHDVVNKDGLFVMEHNEHHNFEDHSTFAEKRKYGQTLFSFFGF